MSMDEHVMVVSNGNTHRDGDGGSSDGDGRDVVMELASNHENYAKKWPWLWRRRPWGWRQRV
jgi:hypothetical protein